MMSEFLDLNGEPQGYIAMLPRSTARSREGGCPLHFADAPIYLLAFLLQETAPRIMAQSYFPPEVCGGWRWREKGRGARPKVRTDDSRAGMVAHFASLKNV